MSAAAFSALAALPRRRLGLLPTPLTAAPSLGGAIGVPRLYLKREELIGFGFGGNKVRALELIIGDALARGADTLVTGAGPQSNYLRASAAAAATVGLSMWAIMWGDEPAQSQGNLLLTRVLGAHCRFTGSPQRESVDVAIAQVADELRAAGRRPYAVPRGGACPLGACAQVLAAAELDEQCRALGVVPAAVTMAVGSGATLAGWALGRDLLGATWRMEGFPVSRGAADTASRVRELAGEAARLLRSDVVLDDRFALHEGFLGAGYGIATSDGLDAIRLAARSEGVFLDPTYTGKAMAGVRTLTRRGLLPADQPIVFVHTGGEPALFAHHEVIA